MKDLPQQNPVVYPRLPSTLSKRDVENLFTPRPSEKAWALSVTYTGDTRVGIITLLKTFEILGYFPPLKDVPTNAVQHIAKCIGVEGSIHPTYVRRTLYRHHQLIRGFLGVSAWNTKGKCVARTSMEQAAIARPDVADLINAAIEALAKARFELPALSTLRRLAGSVQEKVHNELYKRVNSRLQPEHLKKIDLMMSKDEEGSSPFRRLCQSTGPANRKNTQQLIQQLKELSPHEITRIGLADIATSKVQQWAEEARRLTLAELREYGSHRRRTLLLCLVHSRRARLTDDLTTILIKIVRRLQRRARIMLNEWQTSHLRSSEQLLIVFRDVLCEFHDQLDPEQCHAKVSGNLQRAGGTAELLKACEQRLEHQRGDWRKFLGQPYRSQRTTLLNIVDAVSFLAVNDDEPVLSALPLITARRSERDTWVELDDIDQQFIGKKWESLVCHPDQPHVYRRRELEIAVIFELVAGIRAGEIYVEGADSFGNYQAQLFESEDSSRAANSASDSSDFPETADALVADLQTKLSRSSRALEQAVGRYECVKLDDHGQPIVHRPPARTVPPSVDDLATQLDQRLPERAILEALYNTDRWVGWTRHFGPPGSVATQIDDPTKRYVLTTFTYGCGLGPTQAARHLDVKISEDLLRYVNRRHIGVNDLRAACTDLINLYAQFELPSCWGSGQSAAADGSLIETYANNLMAAYHVRYQRVGSIAYRHIADNYVALFSQFVVCGVHEAVYILDGLLKNQSDVHPNRLHADSHGQSEAVFGLAWLLGIELMPRIRNWRSLTLYSAGESVEFTQTRRIYGGTINWDIIADGWEDFLRMRLAIGSGRISPSAILARLNSYSRRNKLYRALQELGRVVRTIYLLDWINNDELRAEITGNTNKVESFHAFSAHLDFGNAGVSTTSNPSEQEKRVIYNQLVCNAVMLQNVADQTQALNEMQADGQEVSRDDLSFFSPYGTHNWKRFGDYRSEYRAEPLPETTQLID